MASLKDIRRRIRATQSMQQIFKAMEMVAAAKLRRAQQRASASAPYAAKITQMLTHLTAAAPELDHPLFKPREVRTTALVVITADRGFAGAYNTNMLRAAEHRVREAGRDAIRIVVIGRKGRDYLRRRGYPVLAAHTDLPGEATLEFARQVARGEGAADAGTIFEPDAETLFAELLPRYATATLYAAMADSQASEESARMVAMGSARKNAGELVDSLTLTRNRLRQAAITREISELVGGAEALK